MEIRLSAEIDEVGLVRAVRLRTSKDVILHRFPSVQDNIADADDGLLLLSAAASGELQGAALMDRNLIVLARPGRIYLMVEDELVVHIDEKIVVIHI